LQNSKPSGGAADLQRYINKNMKKRKIISDYIESLLKAEIVNRCPLCGKFERTIENFTNHHINFDSSVSEYWNLIRICWDCHEDLNSHKEDGKRLRKIKQIKKDLFRRFIGDASYQVLLMASHYKVTSTLPCLAMSLLKLELVQIHLCNPFTAGGANHPTITDFAITPKGKEFIKQLNINEKVTDIPLI
jgi:hypothetical protein